MVLSQDHIKAMGNVLGSMVGVILIGYQVSIHIILTCGDHLWIQNGITNGICVKGCPILHCQKIFESWKQWISTEWSVMAIRKHAQIWPNFKTKPHVNLFDVSVFLVTVSNQLWSKLYCCAAFEQMIPLATLLFVYRFYSSWVMDCDKSKLKLKLHITCFVLSCTSYLSFCLLMHCSLSWTY